MKFTKNMIIGSLVIILLVNLSVCRSNPQINDHELILEELGQISTTGHSYRVQVEDNLAFVADVTEGVKIIDISDPSNPELIGQYQDGGFPFDLFIEGNLVYFADHGGGLKILDITDPSNPTLIGQYTDGDWSRDIEVIGDLAYVADWEDGVEILNISDPTQPVKLSEIGAEVFSLYVFADLVFAAGEILKIYDVSDPLNPVEAGSYNIGNATNDVYVSGNIAYVAAYQKGLVVLGVHDLSNITVLGQYTEEGIGSDGICLKGDIALVTDYTNGLLVLNISDIANITKIGHFYDGGEAHRVQVINNIAYIADGTDGFEIIKLWEMQPTSTSDFTSTTSSAGESIVTTTESANTASSQFISVLLIFCLLLIINKRKNR